MEVLTVEAHDIATPRRILPLAVESSARQQVLAPVRLSIERAVESGVPASTKAGLALRRRRSSGRSQQRCRRIPSFLRMRPRGRTALSALARNEHLDLLARSDNGVGHDHVAARGLTRNGAHDQLDGLARCGEHATTIARLDAHIGALVDVQARAGHGTYARLDTAGVGLLRNCHGAGERPAQRGRDPHSFPFSKPWHSTQVVPSGLYRIALRPFASGQGRWHAAQASFPWLTSRAKRESRPWSKPSAPQASEEA